MLWRWRLATRPTASPCIAYVLGDREVAAPAGIQNAFDRAREVREIIRRTIKPGPTAADMLERLRDEISAGGFEMMKEFNVTSGSDQAEVIVDCHPVGNLGHGVGPSIAWFNPLRLSFEFQPTNLFPSSYSPTRRLRMGRCEVRIPLEDDVIVTERGVEWLYPANDRILLVR